MTSQKTLALTAEGDLRVENAGLVWIDGAAAIEQELRTTLATIRGEDPFEPDHGLRLPEAAGASPAVLEREIRAALGEDDRVSSIDTVDIADPGPNRRTDVEIEVTLSDGSTSKLSMEV